ncbi:threonine/homoserine/homoserine lactone efflux protein [Arcicella aurantiaca]|uniref:Threonine/homoserine/homoserine lactone efflux protein n=1 Tax=Arcicella aurantiaca TaxID=591202 RepID=A0A316DGN5_9BACT|nr:LysE family transporter [Arcicella aurantiaca]PWK17467.1 threonine/homoserine/homoserine lactone efflux protein [Arcicella aurantiaca]
MLIFLLTFFISFVGSIHPGPLNLSVIQITLKKGLSIGLLMAFGGVIPEIIYGYLAVEGVMIFEQYPTVFTFMNWAVIPILLVLGFIQIYSPKTNKTEITKSSDTHHFNNIGKGFFLSLFNPQLLPFWIVILVNYQNYELLKINSLTDKIFFVLGTSLGAFALNYVYAYIAYKQRERIFKYLNQNRFEQIIGWTFIAMGLLQGIKLLF